MKLRLHRPARTGALRGLTQFLPLALVAGVLLVFGCADSIDPTVPDNAPTVFLDIETDLTTGIEYTISCATSVDVEGDPLEYQWAVERLGGGSGGFELGRIDVPRSSFRPTVDSDFRITATVRDPANESSRSIVVRSSNDPPVVDASEQRYTRLATGTVDVFGSVDDPNRDDVLAVRWTITEQPVGSTASVEPEDEPTTTLTYDRAGAYALRLQAVDAAGFVATDSMSVYVTDTLALLERVDRDTLRIEFAEPDPGCPVESESIEIRNASEIPLELRASFSDSSAFFVEPPDAVVVPSGATQIWRVSHTGLRGDQLSFLSISVRDLPDSDLLLPTEVFSIASTEEVISLLNAQGCAASGCHAVSPNWTRARTDADDPAQSSLVTVFTSGEHPEVEIDLDDWSPRGTAYEAILSWTSANYPSNSSCETELR